MNKMLFVILCCLNIYTGSAHSGVIFETDFSHDAGFKSISTGAIQTQHIPTGWDGMKAGNGNVIEVVDGEGIGGKPALKMLWDPNYAQPTASLLKHLTNDKNTGYDELYIRYNIRLPKNFKAGDGIHSVPYWKWGRLWQNTDTTPDSWTENRVDSFYVVWVFAGSPTYGIDMNLTYGANTGDNLISSSSGGQRHFFDYFSGKADDPNVNEPGYFTSVGNGAWDIDWINQPGFLKHRIQLYHTIEWHFKLASSPSANDGIFEMWFDGVNQGRWTRYEPQGNAPSLGTNPGTPTSRHGSGYNFFVFFDNMSHWNTDWGKPNVDGYIWVNDVVVSTTRIGDKYRVGGKLIDERRPHPPANLRLH